MAEWAIRRWMDAGAGSALGWARQADDSLIILFYNKIDAYVACALVLRMCLCHVASKFNVPTIPVRIGYLASIRIDLAHSNRQRLISM